MKDNNPKKYKNKYRIASTRMQNWDYRWDAAYFITIVTKDRVNFFGKIMDKKMELSNTGVLADIFINEIKNHSENTKLGDYIIIPNHVHVILILNGNNIDDDVAVGDCGCGCRDKACLVSTTTTTTTTIGQKRFQNQGKNSISSIIGSYKSAVSRHANRLGFEFGWQSRFHDHIIRNEKSFSRISNYIINNPINWTEDKFCN